jgi:hypothetical protein
VGLEERATPTQEKLVLTRFRANSAAAAAVAVERAKLNLVANNKDNTEVGDQSSRTSPTLLKCIGAKPMIIKRCCTEMAASMKSIFLTSKESV